MMFQRHDELVAKAQIEIKRLTAEIKELTLGGMPFAGIEDELVTSDKHFRDRKINEKRITELLKERFPQVKEFKKEGPAFVAFGPKWTELDTNGKMLLDSKSRWFIPHKPADTINDKDSTPITQRWEVTIDYKDIDPLKAARLSEEIQAYTMELLRQEYPGIFATFRPKICPDALPIQDQEAMISNLKMQKAIPEDSAAKNFAELAEMHRVHVTAIPGMGKQRNWSLQKDGQNLMSGPEGSGEFSQLAWAMLAGTIHVMNQSIAPFCSTNDSYKRHSSQNTDVVSLGEDAAHCKPRGSSLMGNDDIKPDQRPTMLRPYSPEANERILGMINDPQRNKGGGVKYGQTASDARGQENDRLEFRLTDCVSDQHLQVVYELASMVEGIKRFGHMDTQSIRSLFSDPSMQRDFERSLKGELELMRDNEVMQGLVSPEFHEMAVEYIAYQEQHIRARGDDGFIKYNQAAMGVVRQP